MAKLHVGVAYAAEYESVVGRTVNRTLTALSADLAAAGASISTLYHPLPPTFSTTHLGTLANAWNNKTLLAVLVYATEAPGMIPALAASSLGIPVLWTTGEVNNGYLDRVSVIIASFYRRKTYWTDEEIDRQIDR